MDTEIDYSPSEDSMMTLLNSWKKGQKQLNMFWDVWRKEYMASLREMSSYHKFVKGQIHHIPELGQVVLIREDNIARGMWKLGRIEKLNKDTDGYIRTAKIYLPNGRYVQRSISHLHPLEVPDKSNKINQVSGANEDEHSSQHAGRVQESKDGHSSQHAGRVQESQKVPMRKAAIIARKRINDFLKTDALTVIF